MATLADFRAQYPQYDDMPDQALADALYQRHYSDMPRADFDSKLGLVSAPVPPVQEAVPDNGGPGMGLMGSLGPAMRKGLSLGFMDELEGVDDFVGALITGKGLDAAKGAYTTARDAERARQEAAAAQHPIAAPAAEIGGSMIATAPVGMAGGILKAAGMGLGLGGLTAAGSSDAETMGDLAKDTAIGAGIGGVLGGGVAAAGKALTGTGKAVRKTLLTEGDDAYKAQARILEDAGVPLTQGQKLGSESTKLAEETLSATPYGLDLAETMDDQVARLQQKLMGKAGFQAGDVAEGKVNLDALDRARSRFAQRYDEVLDGKTINLADDADFDDALKAVTTKHHERLPSQQKNTVREATADLGELVKAEPLTGQRYQTIRSILAARQRAAARSDPMTADLWGDLAGALDDSFARSVGEKTAGQHKQIQRDYRNFKLFENAASTSGQEVSSGTIPLGKLIGANRKPTRDFEDLVRAGQAVFKTKVGRSGTAERLLATQSLNPLSPSTLTAAVMTKAARPSAVLGRLGDRAARFAEMSRLNAAARRVPGATAAGGGLATGHFQRPNFEPNRSPYYDRYR